VTKHASKKTAKKPSNVGEVDPCFALVVDAFARVPSTVNRPPNPKEKG
jgi:hypothetical protein